MAKTYKITKPNLGTIVEVKENGVQTEKYVFNKNKDVQAGGNSLIIHSCTKSSGVLRIPFEALEDNVQADLFALLDFFDVNEYFN